jgi:exosortase
VAETTAGLQESEPEERPAGWASSPHVAMAALVGLLLLWYRDVFEFWRAEWSGNAGYYSHGPVVPLLAAIIVWTRSRRLAEAPVSPSYLGLWVVALGGVVKLASTWISTSGVEAFASFAFPVLLWGLILGVYGRQVARILAGPVAFLWLMCPLPGYVITEVSFPLQLISTRMGASLAGLAGVSAYQEGTAIHLPMLSLFVGEACSGFRSILALLTLSAFAAATSRLRIAQKSLVLFSAIPIALGTNALRIASIAWAAEHWGRDAAVRAHEFSGLLLLGASCLAVMLTARILGWLDESEPW